MGRQPAADLDMLREERGGDIAGRVAAPPPPTAEEAAPGLGQVLAGGEDRHRGVVRPRALETELETNPPQLGGKGFRVITLRECCGGTNSE